jgi:hypothetical protein
MIDLDRELADSRQVQKELRSGILPIRAAAHELSALSQSTQELIEESLILLEESRRRLNHNNPFCAPF